MAVPLRPALALAFVTLPALAQQAAPTSVDVFERLKGLVGEWSGRSGSGRELRVSYRLLAGGSALVEHWTLSPTRDSMTIYHLDGAQLMATHYCPLGNQPRLRLQRPASMQELRFEFFDATNLPDPAAAHQQSFFLRFQGADSFVRGETYVEKGKPDSETVTFTRLP